MVLEIVVSPRRRSAAAREALEDAVGSFVHVLRESGRTDGHALTYWRAGALHCVVRAASEAALRPGSFRDVLRDHWNAVRALGTRTPRRRRLDDEPTRRGERRLPTELVLFVHCVEDGPPLSALALGRVVPSFLLDLGAALDDQLDRWARAYRAHDRVWLDSGHLELPAYRELASHRSALSKVGRALAARVESATGRPTYYYLMRYFALRRGEHRRRCPSCGGRWARHGEHHAFRCEPCRLVSTVGPSLEHAPPSP